jgi:hypothetical protein
MSECRVTPLVRWPLVIVHCVFLPLRVRWPALLCAEIQWIYDYLSKQKYPSSILRTRRGILEESVLTATELYIKAKGSQQWKQLPRSNRGVSKFVMPFLKVVLWILNRSFWPCARKSNSNSSNIQGLELGILHKTEITREWSVPLTVLAVSHNHTSLQHWTVSWLMYFSASFSS